MYSRLNWSSIRWKIMKRVEILFYYKRTKNKPNFDLRKKKTENH